MVIVADSALQLDTTTIEELNIQVVNYPLFVNGEPYPVSMSMSRDAKEELRLLIKDKKNNVSTSGLKEEELKAVWERFRGEKIITLHQSARMSSVTAAVMQKVRSELPDLDIELFDSHHMVAAYSVQVRVPLVPGITDSEQNLRGIFGFMREVGLPRVALLPYNPASRAKYEWLDLPYEIQGEPQNEELLSRFVSMAQEEGIRVAVS